jgi:hypothetical protein
MSSDGPGLTVTAEDMQEDQRARGDHGEHDSDGEDPAAHAGHYAAAGTPGTRT